MHMLLAWRNIWRNPRRTWVILSAVIIGVWSMIFFGALSRGFAEAMLGNAISTLVGHLRVHATGYHEDPVLDHRLADGPALLETLRAALAPSAAMSPRVRVSAVASNARHSTGVSFVGIDPETEPRVSFYGAHIQAGEGLAAGDMRGIVIGHALAKQFETRPGRKLILMARDASGRIASRAFRIRGTYRAELEATEKRYVFVTLPAAQAMLDIGEAVTGVSVVLPRRAMAQKAAEAVRRALPQGAQVLTWEDVVPMLRAYLEIFEQFLYLWYLVVFTAMGFGIVNTILMAVLERIREFGLLKSLGFKPAWILRGVLTEASLLLIVGMALGNALGFGCLALVPDSGLNLSFFADGAEFFGVPRIVHPQVAVRDIVIANAVVLGLGLVVSLYPAQRAARITPVEALAHT